MIKNLLMEIREDLAEHEQDTWSRWADYMLDYGFKNDDGSITIPKERVDRWRWQIKRSFNQLSDGEKRSDRKEVDAFMNELVGLLKLRGLKLVVVKDR